MMTPTVVLGTILMIAVPAVAGGGADQPATAGLVSLELDPRSALLTQRDHHLSPLPLQLGQLALQHLLGFFQPADLRLDRRELLFTHALFSIALVERGEILAHAVELLLQARALERERLLPLLLDDQLLAEPIAIYQQRRVLLLRPLQLLSQIGELLLAAL